MNIQKTEEICLDGHESKPITAVSLSGFEIPSTTAAVEAPESSTLVLLIIASALWLLRLSTRFGRRRRKF